MPPGWAATRERIGNRDGWSCQLDDCGRPATHCDHKIPHAEGGSDADSNLWMLCEWHHLRKSSSEGARARPRPRRRQREPEAHPGAYL